MLYFNEIISKIAYNLAVSNGQHSLRQPAPRWAWKMMLTEDSQEGQSKCAHLRTVQQTAVVLVTTSDKTAGVWVITIYLCIQALAVMQTGWTQKAAEILHNDWCMTTLICWPFYIWCMPQVKTMHDKPRYVETLPTVSKSSCSGRTNGFIVLSHLS